METNTNQYGQTYVGNDDFRGYLAARADPKTGTNMLALNADGTGYVDNSGNINTGVLSQYVQSVGGPAEGEALRQKEIDRLGGLYDQWQSGRTAPADDGGAAARAAQAAPLMGALDSLDTARGTSRSRAQSDYDNMMRQYKDQFGVDQQRYGQQVTQNEQNLTGDRQAALLQASQGGQGLRAVLAAMGALNGTGSTLADRAITQAANQDIGEAQNSFETNASSLQNAWADTEAEDKQRRAKADAARRAAFNNADSNFYNNKIDILGKLANVFGAGSSQGTGYANQASSLYDRAAKIPQGEAVQYTPVSSLYSPQNLSNYLAGTKNLQVESQSGNSRPNTPNIFANVSEKRKDELN